MGIWLMPKLTVGGTELEIPAGATVLQACELAGIGMMEAGE
jgi:NADH dehydrogenase/NADH:ubiquinone oxidoreductase subunit G